MFDLIVHGKVPFSITLQSSLWQECSPQTFYLNLSNETHFHSSLNLQPVVLQKELSKVKFFVYFEKN